VRVAVLGAGVAGLTAAHRLARAGHAVDVYERWPGLGGQAATLDLGDGVRVERYYHHLFTSDGHIQALYAELGLHDPIEWLESSVAFFARGALHPFTTPLDLLRFRPLSPPARVRLGAAVLALQRLAGDPAPFERVTARAWIERWMGREAWAEVWGPLLRGKFGARADEVAMVWLWSKLRLRRSIRGEDARRERLGYPRGSWEPLFAALAASVERRGGRVLLDRPAAALARADGGRLRVTPGEPGSFRRGHDPRAFARAGAHHDPRASSGHAPREVIAGAHEHYDAVLATVPNDVFMSLLEPVLAAEVGGPYLDRLAAVEYAEALCLLLELDRPFSRFYWTNVGDAALPFVGLIEHTNLLAPARYGGRRLLYVANYLPHGHPLLELDAEALLAAYEPGLRAVNPAFTRTWVRAAWRHVEPAAQPVVTVGYADRLPPLRTPARGLYLANTTQVYPEDRGTNYAVRLGGQAARAVIEGP
jgi:protoporphyrinogen oxidase